ncbi:MAG: SOS response-associated peptidase [Cyclobacteriaceae bacterium]
MEITTWGTSQDSSAVPDGQIKYYLFVINRYTITSDGEALSDRFSAEISSHYKPRYNAAPSQLLPVLTSDQPEGFSWFYWGLSPDRSRNKAISERIINRSAEDLIKKTAYLKSLAAHRCLIPADGFYFWKQVGKKTHVPYRALMQEKSVFGIAGLWEEFETEKGEIHHTFAMITCAAPQGLSGIIERVPLILTETEEKIWLKSPYESEVKKLLTEFRDWNFDYYSVSPAIEQEARDLPSMLLHTPPADQFGNLTLFG